MKISRERPADIGTKNLRLKAFTEPSTFCVYTKAILSGA